MTRGCGRHAPWQGTLVARGRPKFIHVNPIKALFWTAVINGVIAVPMLAAIMMLAAKKRVLGEFAISGRLRAMGWLTTLVMPACVAGMVAT